MFSINNILFLLSSAEEFAQQQSQRLIIPGIIFSAGAIMLIMCVIFQNISRKRRLKRAEKLKRERIKKFSESAGVRYNADEEDSTRPIRVVTESPEQYGMLPNITNVRPGTVTPQNQQVTNLSMASGNQLSPFNQQPMPSAPASLPNVSPVQTPSLPSITPTPTQVATPSVSAMQTPQMMKTPSTPTPNIPSFTQAAAITPSVAMQPQAPMPSVPMPSTPIQATPIQPQASPVPSTYNQPNMGGAVLPGMAAGVIANTSEPKEEEEESIAELVRKRIQEIENKKREERNTQQNAGNTSSNQDSDNKESANKDIKNIDDKNEEIEKKMEQNNSPAIPSTEIKDENTESTESTPHIENKTEPKLEEESENESKLEKKKVKFEYKPEYKPGTEPEEIKPIEIPLVKEEKEETDSDKEKLDELNESDMTNSLAETNELHKNTEDTKDNLENSADNEINNVHQVENKPELETDQEKQKTETDVIKNSKPARVVMERSPEFVEKDETNEKIEVKSEEISPGGRRPVVPKITSNKIEFDVRYIREVQNKLNASREYENAINIKEEEKEKLKESFLEKRMNLQKMKSRLQKEGIIEKESTEKLSKEQISKSLLSETEKGIVYQEGAKISLFDSEGVKIKNETEEETFKTNSSIVAENTVVAQAEKVETIAENVSGENVQAVNVNTSVNTNTNTEISSNNTTLKENIKEERTTSSKNETVPLDEEIKKIADTTTKKPVIDDEKDEVLNQIESLFSTISTDEDFVEEIKGSRHDNAGNKVNKKEKAEKTEKIEKQNNKPENKAKAAEKVVVDKKREKVKEVVNKAKVAETATNVTAAGTVAGIANINISNQPVRPANVQTQMQQQQAQQKVQPQVKPQVEKPVKQEKKKEVKVAENETRTKSILNGIDLDKEILSNKTKKLSSLKDAPNYKKIIVVVSPENCGKTTVAVNLAYELANRGLNVTLIDTDNVKKDVYYYIHQEHIGCLSRLNECDSAQEMYQLGIKVKENLTVFTENKGIEYEINYSKLYKLISYAEEKDDAVIIDLKRGLGQEKTKDLLKLSTNILFVIDKKITTLNRVADKIAKIKGGFINKDVTLVVNMDEGRGINRSAVKSLFKHLEYLENGIKKSYTIRTGEIFTVGYDTKAITLGLISQLPAVTVKENKILADIRKIASHYYNG